MWLEEGGLHRFEIESRYVTNNSYKKTTFNAKSLKGRQRYYVLQISCEVGKYVKRWRRTGRPTEIPTDGRTDTRNYRNSFT